MKRALPASRHGRLVATRIQVGAMMALVLFAPVLAAALDTTPAELLRSPERFDGQTVTVSGTVSRLDPRTSRKGNAYYTFKLGELTVYSPGAPPCRDGVAVTVKGIFRKVKQVGHHTFRNQVDADSVACR